MHVTIYLFSYLCIYYILILFFVIIRSKFSSIGSMELQAHELASQAGLSLESTQKDFATFDMNRAKACYTVLCTIYNIVSQSCM